MNPPAELTAEMLEAIAPKRFGFLAKALGGGHADALQPRAVAFLCLCLPMSVPEAVRKFGIAQSTLYRAKEDLTRSILREYHLVTLAAKIKAQTEAGRDFAGGNWKPSPGSAKLQP